MRHSLYATAALAALLLSSCSDDPVGTSSPTSTEYSKATLEYYGSRIDGIWGRSATDLYVSGSIFAHFDGVDFELIELPSGNYSYEGFASMWLGPDDGMITCMGSNGLKKYDGHKWTHIDIPVFYRSHWTSPEGHVFLQVYEHEFWKFDGEFWSELDSLPGLTNSYDYYNDLAGSSDNNIYALGSDGGIAHFNGDTWSTVRAGGSGYGFGSAFMLPSGPLYATTWSDSLFTFDGENLTYVDMGSGFRAGHVYGNAPDQVYVAGRINNSLCYALRKREANGWPIVDCSESSNYSVWGAPTGESFVGKYNSLVRVQGDKRTTLLGTDSDVVDSDGEFGDMWGTADDGIFVVGTLARRYFEGQWIDLHKEELTTIPADGVWGTSATDVWAVGRRMILHFDGDNWTWVSGANQEYMLAVWSDDRTVLAVGLRGTVMRYQGDRWEVMATPTTYDLSAVWGWGDGAFAAGEAGVILRYDGDDWQIEDSPIGWRINDLFGLAPDDVWAVGSSPIEICHFNGREWLPKDILPMQGDLVSVWASSPRNVFVVNNIGGVLHFDGNAWSLLPRYMGLNRCVWGTSQGELLVGGSAILRYQR